MSRCFLREKFQTLDEKRGGVINTSGGILSRARIVARMTRSDRIDGEERNTSVYTNRRNAHL